MGRPPSRAKFLLDSDWDKKWVMSPQVDLVSRHVGTRNRVCMALTAAVAGAGNSNSGQSQTPPWLQARKDHGRSCFDGRLADDEVRKSPPLATVTPQRRHDCRVTDNTSTCARTLKRPWPRLLKLRPRLPECLIHRHKALEHRHGQLGGVWRSGARCEALLVFAVSAATYQSICKRPSLIGRPGGTP